MQRLGTELLLAAYKQLSDVISRVYMQPSGIISAIYIQSLNTKPPTTTYMLPGMEITSTAYIQPLRIRSTTAAYIQLADIGHTLAGHPQLSIGLIYLSIYSLPFRSLPAYSNSHYLYWLQQNYQIWQKFILTTQNIVSAMIALYLSRQFFIIST